TDWDHAFDALTKYLDNAQRILDTPANERSQKQTDAMTDHFIKNYHRVIGKDVWKDLKFTELRKQLVELRSGFPAISEAPVMVEETARVSHVLTRGDWKMPGAEVKAEV